MTRSSPGSAGTRTAHRAPGVCRRRARLRQGLLEGIARLMSRDGLCRALARPAGCRTLATGALAAQGECVPVPAAAYALRHGGASEPDRLAPFPAVLARYCGGGPLKARRSMPRPGACCIGPRPGWAGHRSFRAGDHPARRSAARRPADRRLGASHDRCGAPLRAFRGDVSLPDDPRPARHGGTWLYRRRDRLSWAGDRTTAPLSGWRQ